MAGAIGGRGGHGSRQLHRPVSIQAVTLRPAPAEALLAEPEELLVEGAPPKRFRTICSLVLGARLSVSSGVVDPWLPTLRETCSPPWAELVMLMVICSGLELPAAPLRLRIISGPLLPAEPEAG